MDLVDGWRGDEDDGWVVDGYAWMGDYSLHVLAVFGQRHVLAC